MNIVIVSYFHNAENYIQRYFDQMAALQMLLELRGETLYLVLGYGDCTDNTEKYLRKDALEDFNVTLVDVTHGGEVYGSVVDAQRFRQLAGIANKLWEHLPEESDIVGLIESDLTWQPQSILKLIDGVLSLEDSRSVPTLLAPMVMAPEGLFYDIWAFRCNGRQFRQRFPYHRQMRLGLDYLEMDSVGSCFFLRSEEAKKLHWPEEDVVVGLCQQAKHNGVNIFLDTKVEVFHP